jgi:hypothetical protein
VTDDELLSLFPFDPAAFLDIPVTLSAANGLSPLTLSLSKGLPFLPPIAGGAPNVIDDFADWIGDLFGGTLDLLGMIRDALKGLWKYIWTNVGGALRWVWDKFDDWWGWLVATLSSILTSLWNAITDARNLIWNRVWDVAGWVKDRVNEIVDKVWGWISTWVYWVKDRVWDAAGWVKDRVDEIVNQVWGWISTWADWVKDRVWDAAGWVKNEVLNPITDCLDTVADVFRGAFDLIGKTIQNALDNLRDKVLAGLDALRDAIVAAIKWPYEHIWEPFVELLERKLQIPGRLIRGEYASLGDIMGELVDPPQAAFLGTAGSQIFSTVVGFTTAMVLSALLQPLMVPPMQMMTSRVGAQLLTVGVIQEALDRGFISPATADDHLSRMGYSGEAKQALLELCNQMPGASDLMRMADKRVWALQVEEKYGQYTELPDQVIQFMAQVGYSEDWTRNFWRAHWDLPSPAQVFEMRHRRKITDADMEAYLGLTAWLPFFRDKLLEISYNPVTRVDLRRLYKGGILSEENVFDGYRDLGYDDEKARWLTDYTKKYYSPDDKSQVDDMADLAVSTFRTAYRRHVILRDEALDKIVEAGYTEDVADFLLSIDDAQLALNPTTDAGIPIRDLTVPVFLKAYREHIWFRDRVQPELEAMGYLPWEVDLLLQLEDFANESELRDLQETVVKEEYVKRAITRAVAGAQLDALQVPPERRDLLLRRWDLQAAQKTRELTVAQLQRGLRDGLLYEVDVLSRLSGMGYNEADAKFLVDDVDKTSEGLARRLSVSQLSQGYKIGTVTDVQFSERLLALGYSQEDAKVLIDIATPVTVSKERQLSTAQLTVGFRAGLVTEAELLEKLATLGYSQEDAELLVKMAAPAPAEKARQLSASQLQVGFRSGLVTETDLLQKLAALGYAQADAELLRDIAAQKPEPQPRRLAVANLKALFKAGTIDKAGLLAELLALGYTDRDAGWIADLIAPAETTE